jgi:hypothetical protein
VGAVSSLSKTTVAPLATVRVPGAKLSPAILTVPPPPAAAATGRAPSAALGAAGGSSASWSRRMITGPATASPTITTTTSSQIGFGRARPAAWLMSGYFYRNPSSAASPASSAQTTRAMATVSRNRYTATGR